MATKVGPPRDYEEQYAEDQPGTECSPKARVWRVYGDEARAIDAAMVGNLRENADVLLVFAGLFSAVVTTFVAQTSQSLQRDYTPITAALSFEMVQLQRALLSGADGASVPNSSWTPDTPFSPSTTDVWVNGLWFISLTLSLITSLIAVLAKQWLSHYASMHSATATPLDQARMRHFRYANFQAWRIPVIVGVLPFLLHVALAMFLAGLVVYLSTLDPSVEYIIAAITSIAFLAYAISVAASVINPACPYRTPLTTIFDILQQRFISWWLHLFRTMSTGHLPPSTVQPETSKKRRLTLGEREQQVIKSSLDRLDPEILLWLIRMSSNPSVHSIAMQAIGGVSTGMERHIVKGLSDEEHLWHSHQALLEDSLDLVQGRFYEPKEAHEHRVNRLLHVQRRFAPDQVKRAEERFTSNMVPRHWFNPEIEADHSATLMIIYLLEIQQRFPTFRPIGWPSLSYALSSVMFTGALPWHAWKALFEHIDISTMCKLGWEHNSDAEAFCGVYIACRSEPSASITMTDFETRLLKFSDVVGHFHTRIDHYILHFTQEFGQPPATSPTALAETSGVSTHVQLLLNICQFLLMCRHVSLPNQTPRDGIFNTTLHSPRSPYCFTCGKLFDSALMSVQRLLTIDTPCLAESQALEVMISRIISSELFSELEGSFIQGDEGNFALWHIRSRLIGTYTYMTSDHMLPYRKPQELRHHWNSSADLFVTLIHITFSGSILAPNETPLDLPRQFMPRLVCVNYLSRGLASHWQHSGIDATHAAFGKMDVLKFIDRLKFLDSDLFILVYGYVDGLSRLVNAQNTDAVAPCIRYLYEPDNLFAALVIAMLGKSPGPEAWGVYAIELVMSLLMKIVKLCPTSTAPQDPLWTTVLSKLEGFYADDKCDHYHMQTSGDKMVRNPPEHSQFLRDKVKQYAFWLTEYLLQRQTGVGSIIEVDVPFPNFQEALRRSMPLSVTHV